MIRRAPPDFTLLVLMFFLYLSPFLGAGGGLVFSQNISINTTGAANSSLSMFEILQISNTANYKGLYVLHSGAAAGTGYGVYSSMTGASTTANVAGYFSATGGAANYAGIFENGNVGISITVG